MMHLEQAKTNNINKINEYIESRLALDFYPLNEEVYENGNVNHRYI